jgi:predicted dehydrogenase
METLRAGIIGTGRAAGLIDDEVRDHPLIRLPYGHAGAYAVVDGVELVATANRGKERRELFARRFGVERAYADYREMLRVERLDIVSVTTHAPGHAEAVIAAAEAGVRGIYCEKAMAVSLAEADAMLDAVKRHDVRLTIGHSRRWSNYYERVQTLIRGGEIGSLSAVVGYWNGSLIHSGTHAFDLICQMVDARPVAVHGRLSHDPDYASEDYGRHDVGGDGVVEFDNGVRAYIAASGGKVTSWDFDFIGNKGILRCVGNSSRLELTKPAGRFAVPVSTDLELPPPNSTTVRAIEELVRCVRSGEETRSNGVVGRLALELGHAFHHSHRLNGARVTLPLQDRSLRVLNR